MEQESSKGNETYQRLGWPTDVSDSTSVGDIWWPPEMDFDALYDDLVASGMIIPGRRALTLKDDVISNK